MDIQQRLALAKRLEEVEEDMQQAVQNLDGSPAARTRYQQARAAHLEMDELVLKVLGARDAPAEAQQAAA
ncbi:hypothetical protein [Pyxidicoccus caerfyrddinensis]|uniref:hypothetical protein n=1 Tax=Pyxidicoccus caerfyrddinensis TaxID=2709663 RepID=UPI0013DA6FDA|nr:hypothetical protein [Pyxidicoccus caerfyrddinensis]